MFTVWSQSYAKSGKFDEATPSEYSTHVVH